MKTFTTTGLCIPSINYMVDITERVNQIKAMVDKGQYFTINRGRQYGKTTTLYALANSLKDSYTVIDLDFQDIGYAGFENEDIFTRSLISVILRSVNEEPDNYSDAFKNLIEKLAKNVIKSNNTLTFISLFDILSEICSVADKPVVLLIDEVDSATNSQTFLDFLAQLRSLYLKRAKGKKIYTFKSVILAGVTDIKSLKRKIRPDEDSKLNSPWNIATPFNVDMSLSIKGIAGMLEDYEKDHNTGMNVNEIAQEIHDYTNGYPFLVCRICQIIDTELIGSKFENPSQAWTIYGISEAVKRILLERNTLFDSLMGKVHNNSELSDTLQTVLFSGERFPYNPDKVSIMDGIMYGFFNRNNSTLSISNRIFETRLYNYFLSENEIKMFPMFKIASSNSEQFIKNGRLDMEAVLTKYIEAFDDIYEEKLEKFSEEEGRKRFLLFIRPIINGTGNYYIEAQTRNNERMDLVIDYMGIRHVVELKIWRGKAYHEEGEKQLANYLDHYRLNTGYLLTYCFNKNAKSELVTKTVEGKTLIEAVV